jgi:hypothetical protein
MVTSTFHILYKYKRARVKRFRWTALTWLHTWDVVSGTENCTWMGIFWLSHTHIECQVASDNLSISYVMLNTNFNINYPFYTNRRARNNYSNHFVYICVCGKQKMIDALWHVPYFVFILNRQMVIVIWLMYFNWILAGNLQTKRVRFVYNAQLVTAN